MRPFTCLICPTIDIRFPRIACFEPAVESPREHMRATPLAK